MASFEQINEARKTISYLTDVQIAERTVKENISLLRDLGVSRIITHDGTEKGLSRCIKADLVKTLVEIAKTVRAEMDETGVNASDKVLEVMTDGTVGEKMDAVYKETTHKIENTDEPVAAIALWFYGRVAAMTYRDNLGIIRQYSQNTVSKRCNSFLYNLEYEYSKTRQNPAYTQRWERANGCQSEMKKLTRLIEKERGDSIKRVAKMEGDSQIFLCVDPLYQWMVETLTKLDIDNDDPSYVSSVWLDVVCALLVATGRRTSEILNDTTTYSNPCPVHSKYSTASSLVIHGQLKKRGEERELNDAYEFLTLVESTVCYQAIQWLRANGKSSPTPAKAHDRFSRYVNKHADKVIEKYVDFVEGDRQYFDDNLTKPHSFRAFYTMLAIRDHCPANKYPVHFATEILGEKSTSATDAYVRKYKLV